MTVERIKEITVEEYLSTAVMLRVMKDRLDQLLLHFSDQVWVLPYVTPVVGLDPNHKPIPLLNSAGEFPVTDKNGAAIKTATEGSKTALDLIQPSANYIDRNTQNFNFLGYQPDGTSAASSTTVPWYAIAPVAITADGAGLPPATEIFPTAGVGKYTDCVVWIMSSALSGTGQHIMRFRTDPLGTPAAVLPAYGSPVIKFIAGGSFPMGSIGLRIVGNQTNKAVGFANGANGDWPNGCVCVFWGFYRKV